MEFNEYQIKTNETAIYRKSIADYVNSLAIKDVEKAVDLYELLCKVYVVLGLSGEAGELAGKMKKIIRDDKGIISPDKEKSILDENGDNLWYVSQVSEEFGESLEDTALNNINKLQGRKERGTLGGSGDVR